jgi:phosphoglycolate phosphatase
MQDLQRVDTKKETKPRMINEISYPFPHNSITNVLFDLDGTVTDSSRGIINSYLYAVDKLDLTENDPDTITEFIGRPLHVYFAERHMVKDKDLDKAVNLYREYYSDKGIFENFLYEGIRELLVVLKDTGLKTYLVTGKPLIFAKRILEHFGIVKYFINAYGSGMGTVNSNKIELISEYLRNEIADPARSMMIGDRKEDILGAKSCGVFSAGVTYGFGSSNEIINAEPDIVFNSVNEIHGFFTNKKG